nr:immunoglobulin light chain junction region [Macaca mulatta]
CQQSHRSSPTF